MGYLTAPVWSRLTEIVSDSLSDSSHFANLYSVDRQHADKAIRELTKIKDLAALGDKKARQDIINYYIKLLESKSMPEIDNAIAEAVDFTNVENNCAEVIFELLLADYSFETVWEMYCKVASDNTCVMEDSLLRKTAAYMQKKENFMLRYNERRERLYFICLLLYAISYGQSCIETLQYSDVNEIGILNKDYIYVILKGIKIRLKFLSLDNAGVIINIQKKTTQRSALNYDMQNPIIVTSKHNSNRISAAGYDVTPGEEDFYYNERLFNLNVIALEDISHIYNTMDETLVSFLKYNQKGRGSFIVSGSDMGIGKSTLLLSMLGEYPDNWGIGILDQQNELQANIKYPDKNIITLVENAKRNLAQSFAYLLKTSRDVLVVSEITMPDEVSELVNAALRLNAGVSATMHSFSPGEVIPNLRNLMMKTDMYKDKSTAEEDISACLDIIIHLKRIQTGRIVIDSIHEVRSENTRKEYCFKEIEKLDLFSACADSFNYEQHKNLLMKLGIEYIGGLIAGRQYSLKCIFKFRQEKDKNGKWIVENMPSDEYFNKMSLHAGEYHTENIREILRREKKEGIAWTN